MKIRMGNTIKLARMRQNISQTELADRLGVDKQYVWKIENGKVNITLNYLDKVIRCLGYNNDEFLAHISSNSMTNA